MYNGLEQVNTRLETATITIAPATTSTMDTMGLDRQASVTASISGDINLELSNGYGYLYNAKAGYVDVTNL